MHIEYEPMNNTADIYVLFDKLDQAYGLKYVHSGPDPLIAAQGFEFMQYDNKMLKKEEDGRNLQYKGYFISFANKADCDSYFEQLSGKLGKLRCFPCVYCKTGVISGTVIFNTVDHNGHKFGKFEGKRFMSLFKG